MDKGPPFAGPSLRSLITAGGPGGALVWAPLAHNPMMAKLSERAGFPAMNLGGSSTGHLTCFTEASLTVTEMARTTLDVRTVLSVPLALDGVCGWGDPMPMHRIGADALAEQNRVHDTIGLEAMLEIERRTVER